MSDFRDASAASSGLSGQPVLPTVRPLAEEPIDPSAMERAERRLQRSRAAHILHARYDSTELLEPARRAFRESFERQIPAEITDPKERHRRAEQLRSAWYRGLAEKSLAARRQKKNRRSRGGSA